MSGARTYADWLAEPVSGPAPGFYGSFMAWLGAVEGRAKRRQNVLRSLSKNPLVSRSAVAGLMRLYDGLAALGLRVQMALEGVGRCLAQGRQDHVLDHKPVRGRLGEDGFEGVVERHCSVSGLNGGRHRSRDAGARQ